ncbi:MAG: YdeI/OmpD-associated family protein [Candidatus Sphingomonas colombiensis]|nr:YdeI/OmpD-associated family protein [Sphingomonas sp.]WEK43700.1 MAG: YdeI/OmpD-associated family protein [Sphingomonas sp.]
MPAAITFTVALRTDGDMSAIPIEFDQRAVFGKARPPVVVTINGYSYRSTIAIMSGETFVPLRRSHQQAAKVMPGEPYEVTLTLDTAPRTVDLPADLATMLDAAGARAGWDRMSFTAQREHAEAIEGAKRPETREKRLAAALAAAASRRP